MKALKALRIKIKLGDLWESPYLHVLLTDEDVIVARCLDFTVASHGENEKEALEDLAEAIKEYVLTAIENANTKNLFDPSHTKYWRLFNELEGKQANKIFKKTLARPALLKSIQKAEKIKAEIAYA